MTAGVAGFGLVCAPRLVAADVPRAPRPTPPYRVWFQPRLFHRDMDLYRHMTSTPAAGSIRGSARLAPSAMPGVAYYQSDSPDSPELRGLVRHCDTLAGRLWP